MSSQHPMHTKEVRTTERGVRIYYISLDGSAVAGGTLTTNGLLLGALHVLVTENGNGDYTFTLNTPGQRIIGVSGMPVTADTSLTATILTLSTVQVLQTDMAGAAVADADFYLQIHVSTAAEAT